MTSPTTYPFDTPANDDENGWIAWASIALKFEGVDKALEVLGMYLALNPSRADALAEEWRSSHEGTGDGEQGLAGPRQCVVVPR